MTQKAVGRFLWTQENPNPNPNANPSLNPNPNTEKRKKYFKKARELASCLSHKLVKDDTKSSGQIS